MNLNLLAQLVLCSSVGASVAQAQFSTVINVPPTDLGQNPEFTSGTQVNIFESAFVDSGLRALDGSEVNVFGGRVRGPVRAFDGSVLNILGGNVQSTTFAQDGGLVNLSGGVVDDVTIAGGGTLSITGGQIGNFFPQSSFSGFDARSGSNTTIAGGAFGEFFRADPGSSITIQGGEFRLDGAPVPGLGTVGNSVPFDMPPGSVLTGTLEDGTPFGISTLEPVQVADGTLTLLATALPPANATPIIASSDPIPTGVREGESLVVDPGGVLPEHFRAGWGSSVSVEGGVVGDGFAALGGSTVRISGGSIGRFFDARTGSELIVTGGAVGGGAQAFAGSTVTVSAGSISGFNLREGSNLHIKGGAIGRGVNADSGSSVKLSGGSFRLDGVPILGLDAPGSTLALNLPHGTVLSGVLEDGSPVILMSLRGDNIDDGTLTLEAQPTPNDLPQNITLPADPAPNGIDDGQRVFVGAGGQIGNGFIAGFGSTLEVGSGGVVGDWLDAEEAVVTVRAGGAIGYAFRAYRGVVLNIESGGTVGEQLAVYDDGTVNILGGQIGEGFFAGDGSEVNLVDGEIGPASVVGAGSVLNVYGGEIKGGFRAREASEVNIKGGKTDAGFAAEAGSTINLYGTSFLFGGSAVEDLALGVPRLFEETGGVLSVMYRDGSYGFFNLLPPCRSCFGGISAGASVSLILVPEPSAAALIALLASAALGRRMRVHVRRG